MNLSYKDRWVFTLAALIVTYGCYLKVGWRIWITNNKTITQAAIEVLFFFLLLANFVIANAIFKLKGKDLINVAAITYGMRTVMDILESIIY